MKQSVLRKGLSKPFFQILFFAVLELLLLTFLQNAFGIYWSPVLLLLSGILVGILFILYAYKKQWSLPGSQLSEIPRVIYVLPFLLVCLICSLFLYPFIANYPVDPLHPVGSDIIPQLSIMVDRYLTGVFPYQPINEWDTGFELFPTYLPAQWMPFILPDLIGLDYRWFAFIIYCLVGLLFFFRFFKNSKPLPTGRWILLLSPLIGLLVFLMSRDQGIFQYSVETLIAAYYLLLGLSLLSSSIYYRSIALALCLLSRYAIVLLVPLFFWVWWQKEKKQNSIYILLLLALLFFGGYGIYLWEDPFIFIKGYNYHTEAAITSWAPAHWQNPSDTPYSFNQGIGLAIFAYSFVEGNVEEKLHFFQNTHLLLSCLTVLILAIAFYFTKDKIDVKLFLLGAMKIYLVVFYNFIQIPFAYLFLTPLIISAPILVITYYNLPFKNQTGPVITSP